MSYAPLQGDDYELHDRPKGSSSLMNVYDRGSSAGALLFGLILTLSTGVVFFVCGIYLYIYAGSESNALSDEITAYMGVAWQPSRGRLVLLTINHSTRLAFSLSITIAITVCTEVTGYVHGTTLRWSLARAGGLRYNANLRLLQASGGAFSMNGRVANTLLAASLVLAYAASSASIMNSDVPTRTGSWNFTYVSFLPYILIGVIISLQSIVGLFAFFRTNVPTWSSSPLDLAPALLDHGLIQRRPYRCMRSLADAYSLDKDPIRPSARQPSAWESQKDVRRIVWVSWTLIPGALLWACIVAFVATRGHGSPGLSGVEASYQVAWGGKAPTASIFLSIIIIGSIQSFLTMGLHCCELVVTLARDEAVWRAAVSEKGTQPSGNPFMTAVRSWQSLGLLVGKPVLHWMFGNAAAIGDNGVMMNTPWILGLAGGIVSVAVFITFIARRRPVGPQPAAYGHTQTLADLVDDWSRRMYWGNKTKGHPTHAGTSTKRLPRVEMYAEYAGL